MRKLIAVLATSLMLMLAGCTHQLEQDEITWELIESTPVVAMDSNTGIYVHSINRYRVDSDPLIDYILVRKLDSGGLRQEIVSEIYNELAGSKYSNYTGAKLVTIYTDAAADGSDARIEIYKCTYEVDPSGMTENQCQMPDGEPMGTRKLRVEIHIPPNTMIQTFEEQGAEQE